MTLPKPFINVVRREESRLDESAHASRSSSGVSSLSTTDKQDFNKTSIRRRSASTSLPPPIAQTMAKITPALKEINISEEFDIVKTLNEGIYTKILLAKQNSDRIVLKAVAQDSTSKEGFLQEVSYNYFLSPHPNIVKSFNVCFIWDEYFLFPMEQAPFGNLSKFLKNSCLPEAAVKLVANQVASALEFMHSFKLVHRDVKPENVLVFKQNFSQVKLCDFGGTKPEKTLVSRTLETSTASCAPEICQLVVNENYYTHSSQDVWQVGILIFVCLTGCEPWDRADISDPGYTEYTDWLRRKSLRVPEPFLVCTPRLIRLLKRLLEPKGKKRGEVREVFKYLEDDWLCKMHRSYSLKRGGLERKLSSSTRSRSTNNASFRRRSLRSNLGRGSNGQIGEEVRALLGSGKSKSPEFDKRFVQQRIGKWVLEAANVVPSVEDELQVVISQA